MSFFFRTNWAWLAVFFCWALALPAAAAEYSGTPGDLALIASVKSKAEKYVAARSILWVEKGYLSQEQAHLLHQKIERAIADIENFTGIQFDAEQYRKEKIEYFVYGGREPSHTITGTRPMTYKCPVIFLTFAAEHQAPYVHETVHIIAWDWRSSWIEEGLAVFLNDALGGEPAFPNHGEDIDRAAKSALRFRSALAMMGRNGIVEFSPGQERQAFYSLAGSFTKYLYSRIGMENLMRIYKAKDTRKAVAEITGKNLEQLKKEWLASL